MKQKIGIVAAFMHDPDILILDEPTAGLDPIGRTMLFKAIRAYQAKNNAGVIIVSHSMEDLSKFCDNLLVLNKGEVQMFGSVKEIFSKSHLLSEMGLDVPMVTRVLIILQSLGVDIKSDIFSVEAAADAIIKLAKRGGKYD